MYRSIGDVLPLLVKSKKPVLFFDTCTLLDLANSMHSTELSTNYMSAMVDLEKAHGKEVWLITSQNTCEELDSNVGAVIRTLEKELERTDRNYGTMINAANALMGLSIPNPTKIHTLNLSQSVKSLIKKLLASCIQLERRDEYSIGAMSRVRKNEAPARKGKPEPKDCEIVECFLELGRLLRGAKFENKILFFTANTKDFGGTTSLKSPLDTQFKGCGAALVSNIGQALHEIGMK